MLRFRRVEKRFIFRSRPRRALCSRVFIYRRKIKFRITTWKNESVKSHLISRREIRGDGSHVGKRGLFPQKLPTFSTVFMRSFLLPCGVSSPGRASFNGKKDASSSRSFPLRAELLAKLSQPCIVVWSTGLEACLFKNYEAVTLEVVCLHPAFKLKGRVESH